MKWLIAVLLAAGVACSATAPTQVGGSTTWYTLVVSADSIKGNDGRVPLPFALDSAQVAAASDQDSGRDVRVTTVAGVEMPVDVTVWDTANNTALIWVRVDTLNATTGSDTMYLQLGGDNRTAARDTTVYDSCHTQRADYHLWWHLDERTGTTARDATGHYAGTITGADTATGVLGACREFVWGDAEDVVSNADAGNFEYTQRCTRVAFIKTESHPSSMDLMGRRADPAKRGWLITIASGVLYAAMGTDGSLSYVSSFGAISTGQWYGVAVSYDGSGALGGYSMLVNAAARTEVSVDNDLGTNTIISSASFKLGARTGTASWFDGLIDEPRIYLDTLTATQIQTSYAIESGAATGAGVTWGTAQTQFSGGIIDYVINFFSNLFWWW